MLAATSEELEVLLKELSAYEAQLQDVTLMAESSRSGAPARGSLPAGNDAEGSGGTDAYASTDVTPASSVSWSQTLQHLGLT